MLSQMQVQVIVVIRFVCFLSGLRREGEPSTQMEGSKISDGDGSFWEAESSKFVKPQKYTAMPAGVHIGKQFEAL